MGIASASKQAAVANKGKLRAYQDDDEDEYDDEIVPYPLNKHNDSFEKASAKTDPRRDFKASQDTLAKAAKGAGQKPPLSDISGTSSQKAYKKTQRRYQQNQGEESEDDTNLLKPQVNK